jgi:DNA-directed RNA polymerase subunit RPC12/RpoP
MSDCNDKKEVIYRCWYCGGELCWDCDYNYDEVYGEGEGIVTMLHCMDCGAEVQYSLRDDEEDE